MRYLRPKQESLDELIALPPTGYWLLVQTLTALGQYADADATLDLMELRGIAPRHRLRGRASWN